MAERRLTVVQLVPMLEGGGVERGTLEVAAELARRGHRSVVISGGGRMVAELTAEGSEHINWPIGRKSVLTLPFVPRLRRYLRTQEVDILHARSRLPAWIGYLAWRGMDATRRPRFVTTVHGLYSVGAYSSVMTRGERVIAVSETVRDYILHNYPRVPPDRIVVIPRGVDAQVFAHGFRPSADWLQAWQHQYPMLKERCVLTLPARLTRLKGHLDFLELLASLRTRGLVVHGLIVGGEDPRRRQYARQVRALAGELGLDDMVTFAGHRDDVREIFAVSDLVLSLSRRPESFGRTVLEALSLGTPVVGYTHGGVGEILTRMYPAGRVPVADRQALLERVTALVEQPVAVPRQHAYPLTAMLAATLQLYASLGTQRASSRSQPVSGRPQR